MTQGTKPNITDVEFKRGRQSGQTHLIRPFTLNKVQQKYDYMLKLIIVGDSGVGKTNIISAFCNSSYHFASTHVPTIGVDFSAKVIQLQNKRIKLQVWDTAGQQRFRTITQTYYKGAAGILLVYSVGNRESFDNVKKWMDQINQKTSENIKVVLIANKIDLPDEQDPADNPQISQESPRLRRQESHRIVSKRQGWDLATHYGIRYHQVSAKMNEKIDQIFYNIAQMINSQLQQQLDNTVINQDPSHDASFKINHSGTIQLSTRGQKRTNIRNKKGIIYHKGNQTTKNQVQLKQRSLRHCNC